MLRSKNKADEKIAFLARRLATSKALKQAVALGAGPVLPELARESIAGRKTPEGRAWAALKRPGRAQPLDGQALAVEVKPDKITVRHPSIGAGFLEYGRKGQPPRPYLPLDKLPKAWIRRMAQGGLGGLAYFLKWGARELRDQASKALRGGLRKVAKGARRGLRMGIRRAPVLGRKAGRVVARRGRAARRLLVRKGKAGVRGARRVFRGAKRRTRATARRLFKGRR